MRSHSVKSVVRAKWVEIERVSENFFFFYIRELFASQMNEFAIELVSEILWPTPLYTTVAKIGHTGKGFHTWKDSLNIKGSLGFWHDKIKKKKRQTKIKWKGCIHPFCKIILHKHLTDLVSTTVVVCRVLLYQQLMN